MAPTFHRSAGFTLVEVLVAVLLVGIIALAATPRLSAGNPQKLELAAAEVAAAIRFARSEAIRTGEVHSIFVDQVNDQVTVEKTDLTTQPATRSSVLYHPVTRQPYQMNLSSNVVTRDVVISNVSPPFLFAGVGNQQRAMFSSEGVPIFVDTTLGITHQLSDGNVGLRFEGIDRTVMLSPIVGRVTVQ